MNVEDAVYLVVDTETTGLDPTKDELVEIGAVAVDLTHGILGMWATLINPGIPIPPEVSAVHYLTNKDVENAVLDNIAIGALVRFAMTYDANALVAHDAAFDAGFLDAGEIGYDSPEDWLCTARLARHIWPDAPTHKNQGLRYWRGLNVDTFGILPHRALGDALVTASILVDLLRSDEFAARGISTVDELRELSNAPIRITTWPYGKHRGKPLDVDLDYARWALGPRGMGEMGPDLRWSLNEVLLASAGRRTG